MNIKEFLEELKEGKKPRVRYNVIVNGEWIASYDDEDKAWDVAIGYQNDDSGYYGMYPNAYVETEYLDDYDEISAEAAYNDDLINDFETRHPWNDDFDENGVDENLKEAIGKIQKVSIIKQGNTKDKYNVFITATNGKKSKEYLSEEDIKSFINGLKKKYDDFEIEDPNNTLNDTSDLFKETFNDLVEETKRLVEEDYCDIDEAVYKAINDLWRDDQIKAIKDYYRSFDNRYISGSASWYNCLSDDIINEIEYGKGLDENLKESQSQEISSIMNNLKNKYGNDIVKYMDEFVKLPDNSKEVWKNGYTILSDDNLKDYETPEQAYDRQITKSGYDIPFDKANISLRRNDGKTYAHKFPFIDYSDILYTEGGWNKFVNWVKDTKGIDYTTKYKDEFDDLLKESTHHINPFDWKEPDEPYIEMSTSDFNQALTYEGEDEPDISWLIQNHNIDIDKHDHETYIFGDYEDLQNFIDYYMLSDYGVEIILPKNENLKEDLYNFSKADKKAIIQWWKDISEIEDNYVNVSNIDQALENDDEFFNWFSAMYDVLNDLRYNTIIKDDDKRAKVTDLYKKGKRLYNKYALSQFNENLNERVPYWQIAKWNKERALKRADKEASYSEEDKTVPTKNFTPKQKELLQDFVNGYERNAYGFDNFPMSSSELQNLFTKKLTKKQFDTLVRLIRSHNSSFNNDSYGKLSNSKDNFRSSMYAIYKLCKEILGEKVEENLKEDLEVQNQHNRKKDIRKVSKQDLIKATIDELNEPQDDLDFFVKQKLIKNADDFKKANKKELAKKMVNNKIPYVVMLDKDNDFAVDLSDIKKLTEDVKKEIYDFDFDIQPWGTWVWIELEDGSTKRGDVKLVKSDYWHEYNGRWEKTKNAIKQLLNQKYGYNINFRPILTDEEVERSSIEFKDGLNESLSQEIGNKYRRLSKLPKIEEDLDTTQNIINSAKKFAKDNDIDVKVTGIVNSDEVSISTFPEDFNEMVELFNTQFDVYDQDEELEKFKIKDKNLYNIKEK